MAWLIWRDSAVIVRLRPYWLATAGYLTGLSAFVLAWGDGVPSFQGTVLHQFLGVQGALLSVLLPWVAIRCGLQTPAAVVMTAGTLALTPSRLLLARCIALGVALSALVATGLPLMLLSQQISTTRPAEMLAGFSFLAALAWLVAAATAAASLFTADRVAAWVALTAGTVAVFRIATIGLPAAAALAGLAILLSAVAPLRANSVLRFLPANEAPSDDV